MSVARIAFLAFVALGNIMGVLAFFGVRIRLMRVRERKMLFKSSNKIAHGRTHNV
jgi:hypothetical protein